LFASLVLSVGALFGRGSFDDVEVTSFKLFPVTSDVVDGDMNTPDVIKKRKNKNSTSTRIIKVLRKNVRIAVNNVKWFQKEFTNIFADFLKNVNEFLKY